MAKSKLLSPAEFAVIKLTLTERLTDALEQELLDCLLPELGSDPSTDLWDLPQVDSKTVAKLSPVLKDLVGHRLDPKWIRKGGYDSVKQAIEHLLAQIETHCVLGVTADGGAKSQVLTVTQQ